MLTTEVDTAQLAVVRAIYEDAFPADLRADFDSLLDDRLVVRVAEGGAPEGFAVLRPLGGTGGVFLRYYGCRGRAARCLSGTSRTPTSRAWPGTRSRSTGAASRSTSVPAVCCCRCATTRRPTATTSMTTPRISG